MTLKQQIKNEIIFALNAQKIDFNESDLIIENPKHDNQGDYATTLCFKLAKTLKTNPKLLAEKISKHQSKICRFNALNGFLNIHLNDEFLYQKELKLKIKQSKGKKILLEYISANPTGPLHIGHARWAALGSCLANILKENGHDVIEEFYINDAGEQVNNFYKSIKAIQENKTIPENGYHGEYMNKLALATQDPLEKNIEDQKKILKKINCTIPSWFSEKSLHENNAVTHCIEELMKKGVTYKKEGALWFKSSEFGDDKDRVLIKSDQKLTYFAVDIAYHQTKCQRNIETMINIWGADHHGYIARVRAALIALNGQQYQSKEKFNVILGQLVSLKQNGEQLKMSKRAGTMITLEEVYNEIGSDAIRYFLCQSQANSHLEFDLDLAKAQNSENPVYYIQYAHARITQLLNQVNFKNAQTNIMEKSHPSERKLLLHCHQFQEQCKQAATLLSPSHLCQYTYELAKYFHAFYENCPILKAPEALKQQHLSSVKKCQETLVKCLTILGISAPNKM